MELDEVKESILRIAVLAERLDERSEAATRQVEGAARRLSSVGERVETGSERFARDATQVIGRHASAVVDAALAPALQAAEAQLMAYHGHARDLGQEVERLRTTLQADRRRWFVVVPALLIVACAIAVAGTAVWAEQARREVEQHRIEAALLRAYNAADVTLCGDRLCARVESAGAGRRSRYQPVALRER